MHKITNSANITLLYTLLFLSCFNVLHAQDTAKNQYGLIVIHTIADYKKETATNPEMKMVRLKTLIGGLINELHYATKDNFLHYPLYTKSADAYLRMPAAKALLAVQKELQLKGLGLKIFDAYRPYGVTEEIWAAVKDERYAANPATGSGHNRGIAVDLTIVDLKTKKELNMGTGFDNFTDSAHHAFTQFPEEILRNRALLKTTMEQHGFVAFDTEWWHYSLPEPKKYSFAQPGFWRNKNAVNLIMGIR